MTQPVDRNEPRSLRILACQIEIPLTRNTTEGDAHLTHAAGRIRKAADGKQFDLIALPELSSIEYSDTSFAVLDVLEEHLDGPSTRCFSRLAQELRTTIAFGFPRRSENGRHISHAVVDAGGRTVGCYDKLHIAQFGASGEAPHFIAGNELCIFDVAGVRVALTICYDIRFPELAQRLADAGVDLVLQPGAYFRDLSFHSWHPFVVTRAMEHGFAWLGLNRAGSDWGGSIWCPGYADAETPEIALGTDETFWPPELPGDFREQAAERLPFRRDRRQDYETLVVKRN